MIFWIQKSFSRILAIGLSAIAIQGSQLAAQNDPGEAPIAETEPEEEMIERLVLRGNKLESVLALLAQLTGRSIIRPQQLPVPEITFDSQGPLTREEMILALESLLSINGIGVTPVGEKFMNVVPVGNVRTQAPELVIGSLEDRIPSGKIVSKLFRLQYLDSQTFQRQVQPFLSPQISTIIPFENSNAVMVTDTVSNLQRLEYVVSEVDKPSRLNIDTRYYTLQYAQASEVATQIQGLIDSARDNFGVTDNQRGGQAAGRNGAGNQRQADLAAANAATAGTDVGAVPLRVLFGSNMAISSDDRTNQMIIMGDPNNMEFFEEMIDKLDVKADPTTRVEVINLKHADALEIASLLTDVVSGRTGVDSSDRSTANVNTNNNNIQRRPGPFDNQRNQQSNQRQTNSNSNNPSGNVAAGEERDSQFSDFMTIIADERTNSLVISGTLIDMELIREMIASLDVLLPQVLIEVVIVDVSLGDGYERGSDFLRFGYTRTEDKEELISIGSPSPTALAPGTGSLKILGVDFGGTVIGGRDGNYGAGFINILFDTARSDSRVNVVQTPTILTTHNKTGTIIVGEARPIVTSTQNSLAGGDTSRSNFQFQDITLTLEVTPLIGPNDVIQLEVEQTFDEVSRVVQVAGEDQPIIGRREASSTISMKNGELAVLGGLQRESSSESNSTPALIGSIPLVGKLFRGKNKENSRSELMVFIRPTVMRTTDETRDISAELVGKLSAKDSIEHFVETGEIDVEAGLEEEERKQKKSKKKKASSK